MKNYKQIFDAANAAAEAAAESWLANARAKYEIIDGTGRTIDTMLDVCAISGGNIDGRSGFARWLKTSKPERYGGGNFYGIAYDLLGRYRYRQEMGLQIAGLDAARKIFMENGVRVRLWTNID